MNLWNSQFKWNLNEKLGVWVLEVAHKILKVLLSKETTESIASQEQSSWDDGSVVSNTIAFTKDPNSVPNKANNDL